MSNFYFLPDFLFFGTLVVIIITLITETMCFTYCLKRIDMTGENLTEIIFELSAVIQLLIFTALFSELIYHREEGFIYPVKFCEARYGVCFVLIVSAIHLAKFKKSFKPFISLCFIFNLPFAEEIWTGTFPIFFILNLCCWFIRCVFMIFDYEKNSKDILSNVSIKEGLDNMDTALLFCKKNGRILLQNSKMQNLVISLTGRMAGNGLRFYDKLKNGQILPSCKVMELTGQLAFLLPDESIWIFEKCNINDGGRKYMLIYGCDRTVRWKAAEKLADYNKQLEAQNTELKEILENLEEICEAETAMTIKSKVHDVLGQKISILLRSVRNGAEPDEKLLKSFAAQLPWEEEENIVYYSLDKFKNIFGNIGVEINTKGKLPKDIFLAKTFYEIGAEALTNAVRHGFATEINIEISEDDSFYTMNISDNGIVPKEKITEHGGLQGMREKAQKAQGSFSYEVENGFKINVKLPKEGE